MKIVALLISIIFSISLNGQELTTDAVYEKISSEYTLNDDGSAVYHYYKKLRLNTHYSFNRLYGETFIIYNPEYQKLTINISRTTHQDGKVVEAPFNAFNEVLPEFAAGAPPYNGLREMVVTHPGLEVGAVVELDYTITTKPGFYPGLMADEVLTESSPIKERELIVHVPSGTAMNYQVLNSTTAPDVREEGSLTSYTFLFNGLSENPHEGHQPGDQTHMPRVFFSTLSFQDAIAALAAQESFKFKPDEAITAYAKAMRDKYRDDVEFALALQKAITEDVNTWPVPPQYIGYTMRTAGETWKSNGGTPCEKTILMTTILREAGINANPVFVVPANLYNEENGCLQLAEAFLLQVNPREKEQMYISAVKAADQNLIYGLTGKTILLVDPSRQFTETISETFDNKVITSGDFVINNDFTYAGKLEISLTEKCNPYYSFLSDSTHAKKLFTGGISSKDIVSTEVLNSAQFRTLAGLTVNSEKAAREQAGYVFWEIPVNKMGMEDWHITYLDQERTAPFSTPFTLDEEYSYSITLPSNAELVNPLELTEMTTDFGKLVLSTRQKDNKVTVKRMLVIKQQIITPEAYPEFKAMIDLWNEKNHRQLVLRKSAED